MTDTGHKNRMSGVDIGEPLREPEATSPAGLPGLANHLIKLSKMVTSIESNECGV
ncbi:hypothetical protein ACVWYS_002248 [Arthrobacter sp. TE12231]